MPTPTLTRLEPTPTPRAVVLLLHGGRPSSEQLVDGRSASWRRMAVLQRAIAPRLGAEGVAAWLLRYRLRGWNAGAPVEDTRWALEEVRRAHGDLPVVLLGHSMGARAAVHAAGDPAVTGVVALAPWWSPADPVRALEGRHVFAAHGRGDRITSYAMTAAYLERARGVAAEAALTDMGHVGHYMVRRARAWHAFAADRALRVAG